MTGSGKIARYYAFKKHNLRKRSKDMRRSNRGSVVMAKGDAALIRKFFLPYGLK